MLQTSIVRPKYAGDRRYCFCHCHIHHLRRSDNSYHLRYSGRDGYNEHNTTLAPRGAFTFAKTRKGLNKELSWYEQLSSFYF